MQKSNPKNKSQKVGNRKAGSRTFKQKERELELTLIRTYPRQAVWEVWLPGSPVKLTTTVTTGLIAQSLPVSSASVAGFATRFGSTFVEYRIVRAHWRVRFFSSTNPGVIQFWIDEKSNAAPTLAEAQERYTLTCSAASIDTQPMLKWICSDPLDLQYLAISATANVSSFKSFTNNAQFGSSIVATDYVEIEPEFQFQFRGLLGV